jgi:hypothetical protein
LHYIKGEINILADNLSRLHCQITPDDIAGGRYLVDPTDISDEDDVYLLDLEYTGFLNGSIHEMFECYLNIPESEPRSHPLNFAYLREQQQKDENLLAQHTKHPDRYIYLTLDDNLEILCHRKDENDANWKIALPSDMVPAIVSWFHQVLGHPGERRLCDTLKLRYHSTHLRRHVDNLKCPTCQ